MKSVLKTTALIAVALATAYVTPAQSSEPVVSVSKLQEYCEASARTDTAVATNDRSHLKSTDDVASMICVGYILGTLDSLLDEGSSYHMVSNLRAGQAANIFLKYLQEHPEINREKSGRSILILSWVSAGYIAAKGRQ